MLPQAQILWTAFFFFFVLSSFVIGSFAWDFLLLDNIIFAEDNISHNMVTLETDDFFLPAPGLLRFSLFTFAIAAAAVWLVS